MTATDRLHMPSLDGATGWLNSEPLGPAGLRGHVVLVDFWTLTCINWLRTEPYVRAWSQAYRDDGLIVIGVHTPEFSFEHEIELVRQARGARDRLPGRGRQRLRGLERLRQPLLAGAVLRRPGRHHPRPPLRRGAIRASRSASIQRLLGVERELVSVEGRGVEAEADWEHLRTPETYLGYGAASGSRHRRRRVRRAPRLRAARACG